MGGRKSGARNHTRRANFPANFVAPKSPYPCTARPRTIWREKTREKTAGKYLNGQVKDAIDAQRRGNLRLEHDGGGALRQRQRGRHGVEEETLLRGNAESTVVKAEEEEGEEEQRERTAVGHGAWR